STISKSSRLPTGSSISVPKVATPAAISSPPALPTTSPSARTATPASTSAPISRADQPNAVGQVEKHNGWAVGAWFRGRCHAGVLAPRHRDRPAALRVRPVRRRRGEPLRQHHLLLRSSTGIGCCVPAFGIRGGPRPAPNPLLSLK